ncbi:hypothetical protein HBI56_109280 [Parastagonospora nodorum]|nr:hypothetical protein HBH52_228970 [Parastagonospora nodorum]KAH4303093.1 hypothetical protein HBI01_089160 [Parastagonospora nodorum]KAH4312170.1 hypothetical protein HBI02_090030 [Parastagonospora nodorum]KAH4331416.1 hypothetical protein HBI00_075260 [Parastagonospora nodorum]KAH4350074.1 hypothetical protein HBH98_060460 [Parastagonospora nodorum]
MTTKADPHALLQDLQQLSEEGRDRMLMLLPREAIAGAFKVALRFNDSSGEGDGSGTSQTAERNTTTGQRGREIALAPLNERKRPVSPVAMIPEKRMQQERRPAVRSDWPLQSRDPIASDATIKEEAEVITIDDYDTVDEDAVVGEGSLGPVQFKPPGKSNPAKPSVAPRSPYGTRAHGRRDEPTNGRANEGLIDLPILLSIPGRHGRVTLKAIDQLPSEVQGELERRFKRMWSLNEHRQKGYSRIAREPEKFLETPLCIRDICTKGKPTSRQSEVFRTQDNVSADDRCVKAKEPCMHLILQNHSPTLRMVPLPEVERYQRTWTDLGFWVRP